jgi:hypothetical protein
MGLRYFPGNQVFTAAADLVPGKDWGFYAMVPDSHHLGGFKPEPGPWRLVVPGDRLHGRWLRQVTRIQVRRLAE